ncbi:hypothetical protein E2C01_060006 [Portunus trituberculatus]|uniref:Uncharacterized protein n=1 Tax=Portunus trituberculatus TaxID=210409 RepID=A0A5B7H7Q2_PORTR|nr:hypothetical protein [Portunus trituberculatus]
MGRRHVCNRARGSSLPFQDIGISQAVSCICDMGRHAPLVTWHPRRLHSRTPQKNQIRVVAKCSPAPPWCSGTMRALGSEGFPSALVRILSTVRV